MEKNQPFSSRFGYALAGVRIGLRENSFRTQLFFTCCALVALVVIKPEFIWWALVVLTCATILAAELFNTALEAICDHVSPEFQPAVKVAKDAAAGAVLVLSCGSVVVAAMLVLDAIA